MPCRFASSGTVATSRSASRAILALNAASNFLRDLVISVLHRLRQSRTLHTLTFGPISGVHFKLLAAQSETDALPQIVILVLTGNSPFSGMGASRDIAVYNFGRNQTANGSSDYH